MQITHSGWARSSDERSIAEAVVLPRWNCRGCNRSGKESATFVQENKAVEINCLIIGAFLNTDTVNKGNMVSMKYGKYGKLLNAENIDSSLFEIVI